MITYKKLRCVNEALRRDKFGFIHTFSYLDRGGKKKAKLLLKEIKKLEGLGLL